MAALTKGTPRTFDLTRREQTNTHPVKAASKIYRGSAVGEDSSTGDARALVAQDVFLGFAEEDADNSAGAAGAVEVGVRESGSIVIDVTGVSSKANIGEKVYAASDNDFTLTSTSNTLIGKVLRHESGTRCVVGFEAAALRIDL